MKSKICFTNILSNAFNKDYTAEQAVEDLMRLMNEATLAELRHGTDSPEYTEIARLLPIQEKLAKAKQEGHPIFDQLDSLSLAPHEDG